MPVFVILIVLSLAFYVYFKIQTVRSNLPMEKKFISGKSSVSLGIFVFFFGLNQLFLYQGTVTYIVAAVFMIVGAISILGGIKLYQYYLPLAIEEKSKIQAK
ncbi:membrane protein [Bacillus coahuilensis m2-6]|uniref:Membrane protein n=1 Tax=Bacillus coahuilensis p1.1.43 TaxID=1150625 RepID=A0A147K6N7_9BACI|nr:YtpI family protein [Bacillus coahuilensis]KUP05592.1 membrane protein [Bacillus coahuilensis p1.1.43]KUP06666.1 membrane protein [Bacillus coahuilensis m2-6]